MSEDVQGI